MFISNLRLSGFTYKLSLVSVVVIVISSLLCESLTAAPLPASFCRRLKLESYGDLDRLDVSQEQSGIWENQLYTSGSQREVN